MHKRRTSSVSIYCLSLLLLLLLLRSSTAKPASGPQVSPSQSLKQLLEQEVLSAPFDSSEEMDGGMEAKDGNQSEFGAPEKLPWDSSDRSNSGLAAEDNLVARLLKDLLRTSKRSSSRYKKGGLRSCFGVRLERIGSFSGLGC
ncbi:natriuretic peptide A-like isoform X1 [Scophthalmus maximus]|uniref:natriuretic peptide A-like isoform X1 n=1 Tax=Scophthalmus maximus TaxID=52904 RepID=UPI0015E0F0CE|nr:natriuretic peptide A-like isoform X1 [Scophthalmus maximus]